MQRLTTRVVSIFGTGVLTGVALLSQADVRRPLEKLECGASSAARVRTTLYFGLGRPKGTVSELEWQLFLRDEVTPRFPEGLTVWEAQGQWLSQGGIGHERTKVLLLVHADTPSAQEAVQSVISRYRKAFEQESVLWETARVCAAS
jgi:Protein of unknown function (DUF3574)